MRDDVIKIMQGAMAVAFMGIFALLNRMSAGFVEVYLIFLTPLPMALYTTKYGYKYGLLTLASGILISFLFADITWLFMLFASYVTGYTIGCCLHHKISRTINIWVAIIVNFIANYLSMYVFASFFGYDITAESEMIVNMMQNIYSTSSSLSSPFSNEQLLSMMPTIIMFSILLLSVMTAYVSYLIVILVLKRIKQYPGEKIKKGVKPSKWIGYLLMLGVFAYLFSSRFSDNLSLFALLTCSGSVCICVLAYYGYRAIVFYARRKNFRYFTVILLLAILFSASLTILFIAFAGFLYITTDLFEKRLK